MLSDEQRKELEKMGAANVRMHLLQWPGRGPGADISGFVSGSMNRGDIVDWLAVQDRAERRRQGWILFWAVVAGVAGVLGVVAMIKQEADLRNQREIREQLGKFIVQGSHFLATCKDTNEKDIDQWITQITNFLDGRMSRSYSGRLTAPGATPATSLVCAGADDAHNKLFRVVYTVNFHLDEFSKELR